MKIIFLLIVISSTICAELNESDIMPGKRGDNFRVWIYFHDKPGSDNAFISKRAVDRRKKIKHMLIQHGMIKKFSRSI